MAMTRTTSPVATASTAIPSDGSVTNVKVATNAAISADKLAEGSTNKLLTSAERTKLAGVAASATANSPDATLLDRASHTGTQAIATVSGLQTALDAKPSFYVVHNTLSATAYTFVLTDATRLTEANSASAQTYTVPPNSSVAFPIGTILEVYRHGSGTLTIAAGAGVTIRTPSSLTARAQYSTIVLRKRATDEWVASGDLS